MFAGHFGLAAAVKAKSPEVPLWALMISTQLLDVVFVPLFVTGIETMEAVNGEGYGQSVIHADYSHSLTGALILAVLAGLLSRRLWGKRGGIFIAFMVFSHWLLDLLVHHPDLPILPGNFGNLPLIGLGLWAAPTASIAVEAILICIGIMMYVRSLIKAGGSVHKGWGLASAGTIFLLLILSLITDVHPF